MLTETILIGIFVILLLIYLWVQFFTTWYEAHYLETNSILVLQTLLGFSLVYMTIKGDASLPSVFVILILIWSILAFSLVILRFVFFDDLRVRTTSHVAHMRTHIGVNHKKISLTSSDNIKLAGIHIQNGNSKVIILCHGGFRSKNETSNAFLAQWLSRDFDIISYDARGHFESGGYWDGDAGNVMDLLRVIDYAKAQSYSKIGIIGRSLGGRTALLAAAESAAIDSVIVISSPLASLEEIPKFRYLNGLHFILRAPLRAIQGLRYRHMDSDILPPIDLVEQFTLPVFLIYPNEDPIAGITESDVRYFYNKLKCVKKIHIFQERLHLMATWHLGPVYTMASDWFEETLSDE